MTSMLDINLGSKVACKRCPIVSSVAGPEKIFRPIVQVTCHLTSVELHGNQSFKVMEEILMEFFL